MVDKKIDPLNVYLTEHCVNYFKGTPKRSGQKLEKSKVS